MLRQLLLGHGRSVAASLIVSAIVASQAPAPALAQSAGRLGIALETASASWTAPSSGRLAMRVSATNLDTSGLTGASVWIGLPRGIRDLRILAPTGWSCRYDEVTDEAVKLLCTTWSLGPGQTAQIYVNGRAPVAGGKYSIWTSAQAGGDEPGGGQNSASSVTSSALLAVSPPPSPPRPGTVVPPIRPAGCPGGVCP